MPSEDKVAETQQVGIEDLARQDDPTEEQKEALWNMVEWAQEQDINWLGFHDDGTVVDVDGNEHESPYEVPEGDDGDV